MTTNDLIVAIELGSSKIAGAVGRKHVDGSLQVLAYASEPVSGFVRRGVVYNIDQTAQCLALLVNRLDGSLTNAEIQQAYVGVGGYTLHSEQNTVVRTFDEESIVTAPIVDDMEEENATLQYPGHDMLMMIPQEYKIGNNLLNDPVGVSCTQVEGNYLNILARTSMMHNTGKSFDNANITIADTSIPPLVQANVLLSDNERRQGCVLVDFGADTTTVSVYKGGYLRFLSVIPMGGQNITRDLCSLQLDEHEAERIKREYGLTSPVADATTLVLDDGRSVDLGKVHEAIEARFEEIILNVCNQIKASGYAEAQLLAGVVCCGGGINLKGFKEAIAKKSQLSKVRLAHDTVTKVEWATAERPQEGTQGVLVGLLMGGTDICCQDSMSMELRPEDEARAVTGNLFTEDGESAQAKRDQELQELRQQKIKEAEQKKAQMEAELKARSNNFLTGFVKKFQTFTNKFENKVDVFLSDEDKEG